MLAVAGLTVEASALTDFTSAADDGVGAMTESITNLLPAFTLVAVAGLVVFLVYKAVKAPFRLGMRGV